MVLQKTVEFKGESVGLLLAEFSEPSVHQANLPNPPAKSSSLWSFKKTVEFKDESVGLLLVEFSEPGLHQAKLPNPPAKSSSLWSFKKLWNLRVSPWDCYWWNLASPASTKPSFQIHQQRSRPCGPQKTVEFKGESVGLLLVEFSEPGLHQAKPPNPPARSSSLWSFKKTVEFKGESVGLLLVEFSEPGLHQAKLPNPPTKSSSLWSFKKLWNLRVNPWDCYWWNLASPASTKPSFQIHQRARPCGPSKNYGI